MTMTMGNPTRCVRTLTLSGLVFAMACEPDLTGPGRETKPVGPPQFVLLAPGTVAQVSAGGSHTCALRTDGTVACWGDNYYGEATPPADTFTQVSAGGRHTCGLKNDRTVACWGGNPWEQPTPPTGAFTQVSAGGFFHTCGLQTDGTVACWGYNYYGEATPPAGTFTHLSAGYRYTCGVKTDGTVVCWGDNTYGQATPPAGTFTQVSAGNRYTCGVKTDGTVVCWGDNTYGQATPPAGAFTQVSAETYHTCGLQTDGTVACWGRNDAGQATPPAGTFTHVSAGLLHTCGLKNNRTVACWGGNGSGQATPPVGAFTQVSAGYEHTCALRTDGTVACWGINRPEDDHGQATPPAGTFTRVSAGGWHTCGLKNDRTVACWGFNYFGQMTPPTSTFTQVSAGGFHTCGLQTDGPVVCWGFNNYGQATPPAGAFTQVSAGSDHTCGVKNDGIVVCWGRNDAGQATPPAGAFTQVSAGYFHTCALRTDGTVACWGDNTAGAVTPPTGAFTQLSAGHSFTCGLKTDGTLACWGANWSGEARPPAGTFTQVSAGISFACALEPDASVACWGSLAIAQTPDGPSATQLVFTVQPSNTLPLVAIQPPVEVMAVDAQGNAVTSFTGVVTIGIGRNGGLLLPGTLFGTTTVAAVNGHATFSDLRIDQLGSGYTLVVTSPDLTGAESASFDVLAPSLETGVRVTGGSAIGPGLPLPGGDRQEFVFDVTNAPGGRLVVRDYTYVRRDGSTASLTVDAVLDAATGIRFFTQTSPTCATFGGMGRVDTGELVAFSVDACDNGIPGVGKDFVGLSVPYFNYSKSGTLTEGEITGSGAASVRVTGGSAIGPGGPFAGSDRQEFAFDVTNAPGGRLVVRDYTFVRRDGSVASLTADPTWDAATRIRSFTRTSDACATFGGIGRVDTGELVAFSVDACDHGTPGAGVDFFGLSVPYFNYRKSGTLSEGEVTLTTP